MVQKAKLGRAAPVIVVLALLAAACGGSKGSKSTSAEDAKREQASVGQRGGSGPFTPLDPAKNVPPADWNPDGELRITYAGGSTTLDPTAATALIPFLFPIYDRLTELDDTFTVKPRLATEWSFPDAHTMLLKLRPNVKFQDGTVFDATAVKVNLERGKSSPTSGLKVQLSGISAVDVVDPLTVKLTLTSGGLELPALFSQASGMMVSPTAIANNPADIATKGAGASGPYKVDTFQPPERISYVRNPDFWDKKEGLLKKLSIVYIASGPQRLNALRAGDVDLAQVLGQDVNGAKKDAAAGSLQGVLANLSATQNQVMLRSTIPPFDNAKLREAVAYAIDKKALTDGFYNTTCLPANQFFLDGHWANQPSLNNKYTYDLAKAKALIAESGVTNLSFTLDYGAIYQGPAEAIQAQLKAAGFNPTLRQTPTGDTSFRDGTLSASVGAIAGVYDPSQLVSSYLLGGPKLLPDADGSAAALAAAGSDPSGTPGSWADAYKKLAEKFYGQYLDIPTCNAQQFWAHVGKVANVNDLRFKFSGLVDFSYLYVKK
jgi:peptide/nickel transport system substrate-binding protein